MLCGLGVLLQTSPVPVATEEAEERIDIVGDRETAEGDVPSRHCFHHDRVTSLSLSRTESMLSEECKHEFAGIEGTAERTGHCAVLQGSQESALEELCLRGPSRTHRTRTQTRMVLKKSGLLQRGSTQAVPKSPRLTSIS